jgi:hypothetical protein
MPADYSIVKVIPSKNRAAAEEENSFQFGYCPI